MNGHETIHMLYLAEGEPAQCDEKGCRRDHASEVTWATDHCPDPPNPRAILGLDGLGIQEVRDDQRTMVWDPNRVNVITVERDLAGFIAASGDTVRVLHDDGRVQAFDALSRVERAVLVARLRTWADALEEAERPEVRNIAGERVL